MTQRKLPATVPALAAQAARERGPQPALRDGGTTLSFAELDGLRRRVARALIASGIQRGERVAVWAPNLWEWVAAALGVHSLGAVLVPLNTRFRGREAADVLGRSGARLLFSVAEFLDTDYLGLLAGEQLPQLRECVLLRGERSGGVLWEDFLARAEQLPASQEEQREKELRPEDVLDLMFSSGTTGRPKGVMTSHSQNLRVFDSWSRQVGLRAGDRYLVVNPFFHSFGYKAGWLSALIRGATVLPMQVFDAQGVLEIIAREKITVLPGPPAIYQSLLSCPERSDYDLSSVRLAVTGAASVPVDLVRRMKEELGFQSVLTAYGLSESCGVVSICSPQDSLETIAGTSGRAMEGVELRCVDAAGQDVPQGEAGEILVRGYNVMQGYFEDPEATAQALDECGWLHTGDIGVLDGEGYLRVTDRIKDMFICGGFNCYPAEIENILCSLEGVAAAAVIGIPDERLGEVGKAYVVRAPGSTLGPEEVIAWCRKNMANYKVPRQVEFLQTLPLNAAGKVQKYVLRERHAGTMRGEEHSGG